MSTAAIRPAAPASADLARLEAEVARDLEVLDYPSRPWLPAHPAPLGGEADDVLIIGAGQSALAAAFALKREKLSRIRLIDRAPAGLEGPWATFARMATLRTPKHVLGPDLGVPSLTFARWYAAVYGEERWRALKKAPTQDWMAYLVWLRRMVDLPIENSVELLGFDQSQDDPALIAVDVLREGNPARLHCRRLVLATGIDGSGAWDTPAFITDVLPKRLYAHTCENIDFEALRGKSIGVLGAGASAFDNAGTALEHGAARVDLFYRRAKLPRVNPYRWMENAGFLGHFADMPDDWKWRFFKIMQDGNQPPPQDAVDRCRRFPHFALRPGSPWTRVQADGEAVVVETPAGLHRFDFAIVGAGLVYDIRRRPELAPHAAAVALWMDRYSPAREVPETPMHRYPYLGPAYEFTPMRAGEKDWLARVHNFTFGATLSMGVSSGALSGLRYGALRLARGIVSSLYMEEIEPIYQSLAAYRDEELTLEPKY